MTRAVTEIAHRLQLAAVTRTSVDLTAVEATALLDALTFPCDWAGRRVCCPFHHAGGDKNRSCGGDTP